MATDLKRDMQTATTRDLSEKTKKPLTHLVVVLDRSGSMQNIWNPMKEALSAQIENLRQKKDQRIKTWLTVFDDVSEAVLEQEKLKSFDVAGMMDAYPPRNWTALFDALHDTVLKVEEKVDDPDCAFLVIVVTDGFENASKRVTGEQLKATLTRLEKTDRWTFVYLGANQDITQVSQKTGIARQNTMSYESNAASVNASMGAGSPTMDSVDGYFASRSRGVTHSASFFQKDDEEEKTGTWRQD